MISGKLIGAAFTVALLVACRTGGGFSRIDVSGKPQLELTGVGASKIQIQTKKESDNVAISYPKTDTLIATEFRNARLSELFIASRDGNTKTVLHDEDGDGLPDIRMTIQILPDGGERALKVEHLTWTGKEQEPNQTSEPTAPSGRGSP
jgi:hypothetical protein